LSSDAEMSSSPDVAVASSGNLVRKSSAMSVSHIYGVNNQGYGITNVDAAMPIKTYKRHQVVDFIELGQVACPVKDTTVKEITTAKNDRRLMRGRGDSAFSRTSFHEEGDMDSYYSSNGGLIGGMSGGRNGKNGVSREVKIVSYPRAKPVIANWNMGPVEAMKFKCDFDESTLFNRKQFTPSEDYELNEYERNKAARLLLAEQRDKEEAEERERRRAERLERERLESEKLALELAEWERLERERLEARRLAKLEK